MRNMEKFNNDQKRGLARKSALSTVKGYTSAIIDGAILRAKRRGRISSDTARSLVSHWPKHLASRQQDMKWSRYASSQLLEVARLRRQGKLSDARYVLATVRHANICAKTA